MKSFFPNSIALSLLTICLPAQSVPSSRAPRSAPGTKSTSPTAMRPTAARSWVRLKAATNQVRYSTGQPIQVSLTATNTSNRGAYLQFNSGQRFDLAIYPVGKSTSSYTWSASRMFIQALGSLWLKPGQSHKFEATIGDEMGQLKPGKYRLVAHLTNSPRHIVAPPIIFEVTDLGLSMRTHTDKTRYQIGESVQIRVTATNRIGHVNKIRFDSGLECDVIISDQAGNPVWNYGANLRFIRVLGEVTWQKAETRTYSATWDGVPLPGDSTPARIEPGRYRVQAVLQSTPALSADPVFIELTP